MMKVPMKCKYFNEHYSKIIYEDRNIIAIQQGARVIVFDKKAINTNYLKVGGK